VRSVANKKHDPFLQGSAAPGASLATLFMGGKVKFMSTHEQPSAGGTPPEVSARGGNQRQSSPPSGDLLAFLSGVVLLVSLVAAVFWQTGNFGILNFDDDQYMTPLVMRGLTWEGFTRAWTSGHVGNWHPLTTLSFMLDAELFGTRWGGYHLHNVLLHALASVFMFAALTRLTGAMGRSLVAAAVFAIHPLRVESVAWITERKDVLSGLFLATTLLAYAFYVEKPSSWRRYAVVVVSFIAGLLSKSMLVTLPLGLLIIDWWPLRRLAPFSGGWGFARPVGKRVRTDVRTRPFAELVIEKIPLLTLSGLSAVATVYSVGDVVRPINTLPFIVRASSSVVAYASYALQLVLSPIVLSLDILCNLLNGMFSTDFGLGAAFDPLRLAPHYPYSSTGPTIAQVVASALFVAAVTAFAWFWRRKWPSFTAGWSWYLLTLLPVIGFIPSGIQLIADRYTYISQIWLVVAVVWGLADFVDRVKVPKELGWAAALVGLLGLTWSCWAQTRIWRDSESLWRHTLSVTSDNAYAHANLASVLAGKGEPVEAAEQNRKALAIESDNLIALSNLATLLVDQGNSAEAIRLYKRAVSINPKFVFGWFNLGNVLLKAGRENDAEEAWLEAVKLDEGMSAAWTNLANLSLEQENWEEAVERAQRAVDTSGGVSASVTLGRALERAGRIEEAALAYRRAVTLAPGSSMALNNLGSMLEREGRLEEAVSVFRQALAIEPEAPLLQFNLAVVLEQQSRRRQAAEAFAKAAEGFAERGNQQMADAAAARAARLGGEPKAAAADATEAVGKPDEPAEPEEPPEPSTGGGAEEDGPAVSEEQPEPAAAG
jgi:tetratricopeptide (TPR) repeat protein